MRGGGGGGNGGLDGGVLFTMPYVNFKKREC